MKKSLSFTRGISLSLALLTFTSVLAACGGGSAPSDAPSATTAVPVMTEAVTEPPKPFLDNLGDYDFKGANCGMLVRTSRLASLTVEEANGEVYNDAVFERNSKVQDRFKVNFKFTDLEDTGSLWNQTVSAAVSAGDDSYDIVMPDYWWGVETGGYFLNMLDYSDIMEFDQPWWTSGWNDSAELYGVMYTAVGALCNDVYANTIACFFNKKLIDDFKLESPYDLVTSRKWTLDKWTEMIVKAGSDANGDGTFALADDKFGAFFTLQSGRAILYATGMKIATKNEQNEWSYNFWNDRFVERYDKTYKIINETTAVNYNGDGTAALNAFTTDRMLFYCNGLRQLTSLREMESDFGIVPYPLYDDKQEDYISYNFGTFFLAIPKSVKDPQLSAVVLEALNAESYKSVGPAYFEVNMKDKYSRDKTTMEMLDMIVDRIYFDFTFVNESATGHIAMFFFGQISGKNPNITSAYEGQRASYDNQLKTMLEKAKAEKVG